MLTDVEVFLLADVDLEADLQLPTLALVLSEADLETLSDVDS